MLVVLLVLAVITAVTNNATRDGQRGEKTTGETGTRPAVTEPRVKTVPLPQPTPPPAPQPEHFGFLFMNKDTGEKVNAKITSETESTYYIERQDGAAGYLPKKRWRKVVPNESGPAPTPQTKPVKRGPAPAS